MTSTMKVVSVNVGLPRTVIWKGQPVTTGIFKEPVSDIVKLEGRPRQSSVKQKVALAK